MMARVLLAEDDPRVHAFLKTSLEEAGMVVQSVTQVVELKQALSEDSYDLLLLDRVLKGRDTAPELVSLRTQYPEMRMLVLSGLCELDHRVQVLDQGADDFLAKPFHVSELMARIRSLLRRQTLNHGVSVGRNIQLGDLLIDMDSQRVTRQGIPIELTFKEFKLLVILTTQPHKLFSRSELLSRVWDVHFDPESNVVDVTLGRLRKKLNPEGLPTLIHSKRGIGYSLWSN